MFQNSLWTGDWTERRTNAARVAERRRHFEDLFARSHAEMRARKRAA